MSYQFTDVPQAAHTLANDQGPMEDNFLYLAATLGSDHQIALGDFSNASMEGYHTDIHFVQQGSDPSAIANVAQLYSKSAGGDTSLFLRTGGGIVQQLTTPVTPINGSPGRSFIPGGMFMQWGTTSTSTGNIVITFTSLGLSNFTNIWVIQVTAFRPTASGTFSTPFCVSTASVSGSGFTIVNGSGGSTGLGYNWLVIGS